MESNVISPAEGCQEVFDDINEWCDCPSRVECGNRPICDENDEHCGEITQPPPQLTCDLVDCTSDGYVAEGPCEQCVCECSNGSGNEICCTAGLFWNPTMQYCDYNYNIPGC